MSQSPSTTSQAATIASREAEIRMELLSKPVYLCAVRDFLRQICKRHGFNDDQGAQVVLAVDEALANVMKHGYDGKHDGHIWLSITPFTDGAHERGAGLRIVIEDRAKQVDIASIKSRDLADVRPGGLGVHIIKQVMDVATYEKRDDGAGMRLTLVKHVSSPAVHTAETDDAGRSGCRGGSHGS